MLTTKRLNEKRRRKELKRKAKRRELFLKKVAALKGLKARRLRAQALKVILSNPELLQKYVEHQKQIKAERAARKAGKSQL
jgi:hypothetical protein